MFSHYLRNSLDDTRRKTHEIHGVLACFSVVMLMGVNRGYLKHPPAANIINKKEKKLIKTMVRRVFYFDLASHNMSLPVFFNGQPGFFLAWLQEPVADLDPILRSYEAENLRGYLSWWIFFYFLAL